jgi:hypothetical protein
VSECSATVSNYEKVILELRQREAGDGTIRYNDG